MKTARPPRQSPAARAIARAALTLFLAYACVGLCESAVARHVGLGVSVAHAEAEDEVTQEQRAQSLTRSVMSPFCPGRTLDTCPSPYATEWRSDIRKWVSEGVSSDDIRRRLQERVPKEDLTGGPSTGVGMWFPVAAGLAALALLAFVLKRLSRGSKATQPVDTAAGRTAADSTTPALDDAALDERLDEEIRQSD